MFVLGQVYRRRELHQKYGGQQQGGISTPAGHPFIFLFTGDGGEQHGYKDGWQDDGVFLYTGEGQHGDMQLTAGNRAIANHIPDGKDIHLFQQAQRAHVRYLGQFVCSGFHYREAPGTDGEIRQAFIFELVPIADLADSTAGQEVALPIRDESRQDRLRRLREVALGDSVQAREPVQRRASFRRRSEAIRQYVLERANGYCEGCNLPAPFMTAEGKPYLEPHHIRRLSDGGPDHPRWVAAVCANCHRRAHYSRDAVVFNQTLELAVGRLESED
jgi:5-methylcytosine-specific restriction protein A